MTSSYFSRKWQVFAGAALVLVIAALCVGAYWFWRRPGPPRPDMTAVMEANNRGVGHMEQFKYELAQADFEKVVQLAPTGCRAALTSASRCSISNLPPR